MRYAIERFVNVRAAYMPSFAADGSKLSFISNITGIPQVWQVDLTAARDTIPWPKQLTFAADRVLAAFYSPTPGDNRLFYAHDLGGNENAQLFLLEENGQERCLSTGYEDALHIPGNWSADGQKILFAANRRDRSIFDIYAQPLDGGVAQMIWQHDSPGFLLHLTWSPNGKRIAFTRMKGSADDDLLELDLESGEVRQLNPPDEQNRFTKVYYSKDGRYLVTNTNLASDFLHVARLDLITAEWQTLVSHNWDTEHLAMSPDGRYLAYAINEDGASRIELHDLESGLTLEGPDLGETAGVVAWFDMQMTFSADSRLLAYSFTSATRTSDVHIWDFQADSKKAIQVTASSHGGIAPEIFTSPQLIRYKTFDGRLIPAWFYKPKQVKKDQRLPVIVWVHGGPESQYKPYFNFLVQYFTDNGYAVLAPNVRGSTGYGKAYSHLDDVRKRMDSVADLAHAVHWLKEQPGIDGQRIVVYGGSYGGFMVLSSLTTYPDLWAAGVNIVGISNFVTFLENTSGYRRAHRESEYGTLADDREFLQEISPLSHMDKIKAPLIVIHGANDPRVPVSEAEQLVAHLEKRGIHVQYHCFDDEGHGLAKLKNKIVAYPEIVRFLDDVLK